MKLLSLFKVILVICCYFFVPMQSASAQIADCVVNMPDGLNSRSDCFVNDQDFSPTPVDDIFIDIMYTEAGTTCGPVNYSGVWTWNPDSYGFQHGSSAPWSQFFVGVLH